LASCSAFCFFSSARLFGVGRPLSKTLACIINLSAFVFLASSGAALFSLDAPDVAAALFLPELAIASSPSLPSLPSLPCARSPAAFQW
jgi:hypothetical protein